MSQLNGIDTKTIENLVSRYQEHPDEAISSWSSTVLWQRGFQSTVAVRGFSPIAVDEPEWLAGTNHGPNAPELLLGALGSCMSTGFIAIASLSEVSVKALETTVSGEIDLQVFLGLKEGNAGFDQISVSFVVDSPATDEQIETIIAQVSKLSPVKNTIERAARIEHHYVRA
ncbi:MAG: OsmC family protein [Thermaerobacter sp.]|nr:OsmC family protein [Thermaerobacter sp.]